MVGKAGEDGGQLGPPPHRRSLLSAFVVVVVLTFHLLLFQLLPQVAPAWHPSASPVQVPALFTAGPGDDAVPRLGRGGGSAGYLGRGRWIMRSVWHSPCLRKLQQEQHALRIESACTMARHFSRCRCRQRRE